MKIKFLSQKRYPEFEVYKENKIVIHLKIDAETQAFRITCVDNRRVFFIAEEMVKKTKITTLLNEYSQQLGFLTKNKSGNNTGEIEIEGSRYSYMVDDNLKGINLFEDNAHHPVLSCKFEPEQPGLLNQILPNQDYLSYLLFSLVWFRFLTKEHAAFVQFAVA